MKQPVTTVRIRANAVLETLGEKLQKLCQDDINLSRRIDEMKAQRITVTRGVFRKETHIETFEMAFWSVDDCLKGSVNKAHNELFWGEYNPDWQEALEEMEQLHNDKWLHKKNLKRWQQLTIASSPPTIFVDLSVEDANFIRT